MGGLELGLDLEAAPEVLLTSVPQPRGSISTVGELPEVVGGGVAAAVIYEPPKVAPWCCPLRALERVNGATQTSWPSVRGFPLARDQPAAGGGRAVHALP